MPTPKEAIYDAQINPLMAQIIEICREHKIAVVASFALGPDDPDNPDSQLMCTTTLIDDEKEPTDAQVQAARLLVTGPPLSMLTVRDGDGKVKSMTAFV